MIHVDVTGYLGKRVRRDFPDLRSALDWLWPRYRLLSLCQGVADSVDEVAESLD